MMLSASTPRYAGAFSRPSTGNAVNEHGDVLRLEAVEPPEWRLRVGALRVRFGRDTKEKTLLILRILPRDKAYR